MSAPCLAQRDELLVLASYRHRLAYLIDHWRPPIHSRPRLQVFLPDLTPSRIEHPYVVGQSDETLATRLDLGQTRQAQAGVRISASAVRGEEPGQSIARRPNVGATRTQGAVGVTLLRRNGRWASLNAPAADRATSALGLAAPVVRPSDRNESRVRCQLARGRYLRAGVC